MRLSHAAEQTTRRGSSESFTGTAWQQTLAVGDAPNPLHVARVTFEPGARTVWHAHPRGQILIATTGVGRYQSEGADGEQATWMEPVTDEDYTRAPEPVS